MSITEISVSELKSLLDQGCLVIDVRETDEYVAGHVLGAVSVPLSVLTENVGAFPDDVTTYVICQVGGRSMRACEYLEGFGKQVVNVAGGTGAWIAAGNVVVSGESPR
jgi:rhodanese-related sulfurtransferase